MALKPGRPPGPLGTVALVAALAFAAGACGEAGASRSALEAGAAPGDTLRSGSPEEVGLDADRIREAVVWVGTLVDDGKVPGAQLLVARKGVVVARASFGVIDVQDKRPLTDSSLLWLASITKPFTATAVMTLVERGRLDLDEAVERYLPPYAGLRYEGAGGPVHRHVTIRQLLSHSSGLGQIPTRHSTMGAGWLDQTLAFAVDSIAVETLRFEPGTDWTYANAGYVTLGRIVEVVTGEEFNAFVRREVLDPLGIGDLVWATEFRPELAPRIAEVYRETNGGLEPYFSYEPDFPYVNGAPNGGLFGTVLGVAKLAQTILQGGEYGGTRILERETVREVLTVQTPGAARTRGLGWALRWPDRGTGGNWGRCMFGHTGSAGTHVWVDRDLELMGLLFLNWTDDRGSINVYRDHFQHRVYGALTEEAVREGAARSSEACVLN